MKRSFLPILGLLLVLGLAGTSSAELSGEITVWAMGAEGTHLPKLARAFEEDHPGTTINTQAVPWGGAHDRLITAVAGGIAPDVTQLGTTWVPEFAAMGALRNLARPVENSDSLGNDAFFEQSLRTGKWEGGLYALPWYVDTRVMFYRTDLAAEAGWDRFPETWDELEQFGADLTRDKDGDGRTDQYAFNFSAREEGLLLDFIWQNGGRAMSDDMKECIFASPETIEAMAFYKSIFDRGYSTEAVSGQIDPIQAFRDGYFAAWITGPWMVGEYQRKAPDLEGRWAVAMLPGRKTRTSFLGGSNLAIFKSSQNPELAWAFVEYLSQPRTQIDWYKITGDLPAAKVAWDAPEFAQSPTWSVFRRQLGDARATPPLETWEAMAEVIKNEMENMILGDVSPETTATRIEEGMKGILSRRRVGPGNVQDWMGTVIGGGILVLLILVGMIAWKLRHEKNVLQRCRIPAVFLIPVLLHFTLFILLPITASLLLSFTNYDIYAIADWHRTSIVGFENYIRLLQDPLFWRSVLNTGYFMIVAGPLTIVLALGAAILLNSKVTPIRGLFRTGFFLPVVTPLVAVAVVWRWIYSPQFGLLNWGLGLVGIPEQEWLADPLLALPALIVLAIWKNFGYSMVIFLAGLQSIPSQLYEAASIDGANRWQQFRNVTLPLLRPTTVFIMIITTIGYMQFFAEPYVMTDMGGPQNRTLSIVLYLYKEGFKFFHLGYASAIAYTLCVMIAVLSVFQMRWVRGEEN
ncbi:extracellular solute-binding protein [bacterium]|nr:extracellular solute-binding protein [bacterium]